MAKLSSFLDKISLECEEEHLAPEEHIKKEEVYEIKDVGDILPSYDVEASKAIESLATSLECQRVAIEAEFMNNIADAFKGMMSGISDKFSSITKLFRGTGISSKICKDIVSISSDTLKEVDKLSYSDYSNMTISQPEGFQGEFLPYVKALIGVADTLYKETDSYFNEYVSILKTFLTNKDAKSSLKDHTSLYIKVKKQREAHVAKIESFFKANNYQSKVLLKKVLLRLGDLPTLVNEVKRLDEINNRTQSADLQNKVTECSELLATIRDEAERDELPNVSGAAATNISKGAFEFAKYMEYVSIFRWRVDQIMQSVYVMFKTIENNR